MGTKVVLNSVPNLKGSVAKATESFGFFRPRVLLFSPEKESQQIKTYYSHEVVPFEGVFECFVSFFS